MFKIINVSIVLTIQFSLQSSPEHGIDQMEVRTTRLQIFLASINFSAQESGDMCTMNCRFKHSIISLHLCKECSKINNTILTPHNVLNALIYESLHFDEIQ